MLSDLFPLVVEGLQWESLPLVPVTLPFLEMNFQYYHNNHHDNQKTFRERVEDRESNHKKECNGSAKIAYYTYSWTQLGSRQLRSIGKYLRRIVSSEVLYRWGCMLIILYL